MFGFILFRDRAGYPDFTMNELVGHVEYVLDRRIPAVHIPYSFGLLDVYCFDALSFVTRNKLTISPVHVKKFCVTAEFDAKVMEFGAPRTGDITFKSE